MRVYLETMRLSFRRHRAYGAANVAGLITNGFFGVVRSYVFIALFQARPTAEGYDLANALTYVWVTQALIMPVLLWSWLEIALTIRSGDVASDLSRPWSYFGYWLSRDLGRAAYHVLYRSLPTLLLGLLLFRIKLPSSPMPWALFACSVLLAVVLGFCIRFMVNVLGFWTTDVRGLYGIVFLGVNFLSGFLVPLAFFPPAVRSLVEALPFAGLISVPMNMLLERAERWQALRLLVLQAFWVLVFVLLSEAVLRAGARKLVVQGG